MSIRFAVLAFAATAVLAATPLVAQQQQGAPNKQVINRPDARPGGVLSPAVRVGNVIFLSGVMGTKPGGGAL